MKEQADKLVRLDEDAHKKVKIEAAKKGISIKQYLTELIFGKLADKEATDKK